MREPAAARPPLDASRLLAGTPQLPTGVLVEVLAEAGSTNALLTDRARGGAPEGLVLVAEHQTAGRGRLDRTWEVPARAALTFSVLLRPSVAPADWPWLPLLTGLAIARALRAAGHAADLKWPNDVLIGGAKVAGILVERIETPSGPAAVVGIGINADQGPDELPVATATSLRLVSGSAVDRTDLLVGVLASLFETYGGWIAGGDPGTDRLRSSYAESCVTLGEEVRVDLPDGGTLVGRATGVDPGGRLEVTDADGRRLVGAGDVVHVRLQ